MIKRFAALFLLTAMLLPYPRPVQAQALSSLTCTPVTQTAQNNTTLECRLVSDSPDYLLVGKYKLPFHLTELVKVSSAYAAAIGVIIDAQAGSSTIAFSTLGLGDANNPPRFQPAPPDSLSFLLTTDEPMATVKAAFTATATGIMPILSPDGNGGTIFNALTVNQTLAFDGSLILETFRKFAEPIGLLQILNLARACFDQSAGICVSTLIQNL